MNKNKIPTLIGVIILVASLATGVFFIENIAIFRLGAVSQSIPQMVLISNISDTSFSVSWITAKETVGYVKYGENPSYLNKTESENAPSATFTHLITVTGVKTNTLYFFRIYSENVGFDDNGSLWQVKTATSLPQNYKSVVLSGSVYASTSIPESDALVFIDIDGAELLSAKTASDGSWLISTAMLHTKNLKSFFAVDEKNTLIKITVNSPKGSSFAYVYPISAKPVPTMTIGNRYDYRKIPTIDSEEIPKANLDIGHLRDEPSIISPSTVNTNQ